MSFPTYHSAPARCFAGLEKAFEALCDTEQFLKATSPETGNLNQAIRDLLAATSMVNQMACQIHAGDELTEPRYHPSGLVVYHYRATQISLMLSELTRILESLSSKRQAWQNEIREDKEGCHDH